VSERNNLKFREDCFVGLGFDTADCFAHRLFNHQTSSQCHNKDEEPMGEETTSLGGIHISPNAVATIAYHATLQSYGVVGLTPRNLADGIVKTITRDPSRGVSVNYNGDVLDIEIHIIVEYGTRINTVAESVASAVRFQVEKALGLKVNTINVHVAGLRVSNTD
jgi:uncharacterized alkaline shock family protein YloU